ncbi:MAG: outer membrane protein assembly factor BamA [Candidatus Zixiibacteriota bacterium]|jgi:outer membrane protein insertion porin family
MMRAWTALVLAAMIALAVQTRAQTQETYRVVDVEVVGNRVATPSLILGVAAIDRGSPLTATVVQQTIHRLYGLGIFSDVQIKAEPVEGGIKVYIVVKELPKLSGLEFTGNNKIDTKDFREKLRLGVGGYISPYLVFQKKQEILDMYSKKGYFRAQVTPQLQYSEDSSSAVLTYKIKENSKVKVEKVILTGNKRVNADDLINKMRNRKHGFLKSSDFAQDKYQEDLQKIADEYHKKGFIDAYVISDSTAIDTATNRMTIYIDVYEGPKYYFGEVHFENNEELPTKPLEDALKFHSWDVFNAEKYDESLFELYSAYQEIGHLHVQIADQRTTRNDSLIDITYDITEGLPSHINLVKIVGNMKTKDHVIRRELSSMPGQVFNRTLLIRSVRDVMALNYFGNVEPVPINLPNGDVDLEFKVDEKQTAQISAGAGYNSQDKLVGTVGMGIPNFRGNGQNLSFNVEFGSKRNSYSVSFTEPWLFGRPTLLGTDLYSINRRWYDDYTEGRQGASLRLGRRLRWPDNFFRVYASYRLERNRFYDFSTAFDNGNRYRNAYYAWQPDSNSYVLDSVRYGGYYPGSVGAYNQKWNTASRVSFTVTRDSRDLPEFATRGSMISYTFSNTGNIFGGYWNYQKHDITAAKFIPVFWKFALAAKVQFGAVTAPNDSLILLSDRFTPGGTAYDGVVRGYDDGVLTPDSTVVGGDTTFYEGGADPRTETAGTGYVRVRGKYMLITNIELQLPIIQQQLYVLGFFDAGNSFLHSSDIKLDHLYKGVGIGFRLMIPGMGTLGFDFGYPLDDYIPPGSTKPERGWKPHFQIGTTFR